MEAGRVHRLRHFPVTLFSTVMGMSGLGIAYDRYDQFTGSSIGAGKYIIYAMIVWLAVLSLIYLMKIIRYPGEVKEEFAHPVKINFFPAFSISLLLLSTGMSAYNKDIARVLCYAGAGIQIVFTYAIIYIWFFKDFKLQAVNPSWFIPVVGVILVPVAGKEFLHEDILWFFFSIGIILWPILYTLVKYRIIFNEKLPAKFLPTKFILIAPPAVGFIAYIKLTDSLDTFSRVLYFFSLFTTIMLFTMFRHFYKVPYFISWWAYTFPMDAMTISTVLMYKLSGNGFYKLLGTFLLISATLVVLHVLFYTLVNAYKGRICVPDS